MDIHITRQKNLSDCALMDWLLLKPFKTGVVNYPSIFNALRQRLGGNAARLKVLTDLIVALLKTRSVNLVHLATHSELSGAQHTIYRRLQRFFAHWNLPQSLLAQYILSRIPKLKNGYVLSIDRTN